MGNGYGAGGHSIIEPLPPEGAVAGFSNFSLGIGTGLAEPVAPFRVAPVFGVPLNQVDASNWNAPPQLTGITGAFDLSSLTPNHEVVVALLNLYNVDRNTAGIVFRWYRDGDPGILYSWYQPIPDPTTSGYQYWAWFYSFSYIGYVPWEISANGAYHVDISIVALGGAEAVLQTVPFTVTGIPVTWSKIGDPILATVAVEQQAGWAKIGAAINAAVGVDVQQGWAKVGTPISAAVGMDVQSGWAKVGTPITAQIVEGFLIPPQYNLAYSHRFPAGDKYNGKAEECTTQVTVPLPNQLFASAWAVDLIAAQFESKVTVNGGQMLDLKIYEDTSPTFETKYYVVATAAPAPVPRGAVGFPFPWAIVIPLILVAVIIVAFTWLIIQVKTIDWGSPAAVLVAGVAIALAAGGLGLLLLAAGGQRPNTDVTRKPRSEIAARR